jgi:hypothetical protein
MFVCTERSKVLLVRATLHSVDPRKSKLCSIGWARGGPEPDTPVCLVGEHGVHATLLPCALLASGTIHDARYLYIYQLHGQAGLGPHSMLIAAEFGIRPRCIAGMWLRLLIQTMRGCSWKIGCRWPRPDLRWIHIYPCTIIGTSGLYSERNRAVAGYRVLLSRGPCFESISLPCSHGLEIGYGPQANPVAPFLFHLEITPPLPKI